MNAAKQKNRNRFTATSAIYNALPNPSQLNQKIVTKINSSEEVLAMSRRETHYGKVIGDMILPHKSKIGPSISNNYNKEKRLVTDLRDKDESQAKTLTGNEPITYMTPLPTTEYVQNNNKINMMKKAQEHQQHLRSTQVLVTVQDLSVSLDDQKATDYHEKPSSITKQ